MVNQDIAPDGSRYVPLTQQPYCCVPTCIQMVMYRHAIPLVPAEVLGRYMGLTVPKNEAHLFWNVLSGEMPRAGWGTQIYKPEYSPNEAFRKLKIPLTMELHLIDEFESWDDAERFLENAQAEDGDVLVCYSYGVLFDTESRTGHVNVFDRIEEGNVRLIDPEKNVPKWRMVGIKKLFEAMKAHGPGKSGGFWTIRKTG